MKKLILVLLGFLFFGFCGHEDSQTMDLKIMSYNIRHGMGSDGVLDLSRSASIIKAQEANLCGLQEIDDVCVRSGNVEQTDSLAQKTGMKGTFGAFMAYQGGEYGMATLMARPLVSTEILRLPDGKFEPRSAIVHEVQLADDCIIAFANVHFEWIAGEEGSTNRLKQAKTLVTYIDGLDRAAIITGDFNCSPESPTIHYFKEQGFVFVEKGADNLSYQGTNKAEIDHLIYRNYGTIKFKPKKSYLLEAPVVSDHRPLITELEVTF